MEQPSQNAETSVPQDPQKDNDLENNSEKIVDEQKIQKLKENQSKEGDAKVDEMNQILLAPLEPSTPKILSNDKVKGKVCETQYEHILDDTDSSLEAGKLMVVAEVLHRNISQEVKGAMPSPKDSYSSNDEFVTKFILSDGSQIIVEETSSEHTDTAITETASEVNEFVGRSSPPVFPKDSVPMLGQKTVVEKLIDIVPTYIDATDTQQMEDTSSQLWSLEAQMKGSPTSLIPMDSGTKRDRKEVISTEDDSDSIAKLGLDTVVNSLYSKSRKKMKAKDKSIEQFQLKIFVQFNGM